MLTDIYEGNKALRAIGDGSTWHEAYTRKVCQRTVPNGTEGGKL
ncbi:hypothetical protein [Butyrivibrio sp. WCD3002]|nr:hypothetical protein [Butyrivibrio sp. WCD3002]